MCPYIFAAAAAAAKSLLSCPTLCNPINGSPPGSHPWDSPGKNTGVGCHFLLQCNKVKVKSLSRVRLLGCIISFKGNRGLRKARLSGVILAGDPFGGWGWNLLCPAQKSGFSIMGLTHSTQNKLMRMGRFPRHLTAISITVPCQ